MNVDTTTKWVVDLVQQAAQEQNYKVYLVGGFVRDLVNYGILNDLDFAVEGDAIYLAEHIEASNPIAFKAIKHPQFGTARLLFPLAVPDVTHVDLATARSEIYEHPGALPQVKPSTIEQDLYRRDFTINAMAIQLPDISLLDPYEGWDDLRSRNIQVLHERSFIDDPTRIFRAARYEKRFGFHISEKTLKLISEALPILARLSGERVSEEFRRIFAEQNLEETLNRLHELEVLKSIHPQLRGDGWFSECYVRLYQILETAPADVLWCILLYPVGNLEALSRRLGMSKALSEAALRTQQLVSIAVELPKHRKWSEKVRLIEAAGIKKEKTPVSIWAAAAISSSSDLIEYSHGLQNIQSILTGDDLKQMGLPPGPRFAKILSKLRDARLDGEIATVEEERALVQQWITSGEL